MTRAHDFRHFAERKSRTASEASLHALATEAETPLAATLTGIGNEWTRRHYGGPFHVFDPPAGLPAVSLVFVQSADGNTAADDPGELGGGPTDKHLIYEGLSRVAAHGVLAGATTIGPEVFFSVWHPALVALRHELALPRHPAQIIVSNRGNVDIDKHLIFNVPDVPVFVLAGPAFRDRWAGPLARRPWIIVLHLEVDGIAGALARLRRDHGIERISAVGGRTTASMLVDAGLVQDLYLTTTARTAGEPDTPFYVGLNRPTFDLIVRKRGTDAEHPITFEHLALGSPHNSVVSQVTSGM
jgi:riboflavin biosynthesis pyrimidine reductase